MLQRLIPNIFNPAFWRSFLRELRVAWKLIWDPRVPPLIKLIPLAVALYIISPLDIIPGFLLFIGQLDDLALLLLGIRLFIRLAPDEVVDEYRGRLAG